MLWVFSKNFHFEVFVLHLAITEQQASNTTKIYFLGGGEEKKYHFRSTVHKGNSLVFFK